MRRTLLSCTSLARNGLMGLAFSALLPAGSAFAADFGIADALSGWLDLNHQEFAVLATAMALPPVFFGWVQIQSTGTVLVFNRRQTGTAGGMVPVHAE